MRLDGGSAIVLTGAMKRMTYLLLLLGLCIGAPLRADELGPFLAKLKSRVSKDRSEAEAELKKRVKPADLPRLVSFYKSCQLMACYVGIRLVDGVGGAPAKQALARMVPMRHDYGAVYAANSLKYRHQDDSGFTYLLARIRSPKTPENFRHTLINYLTSMGAPGRKTLIEMAADAALANRLRIRALERLSDQAEKPDEAAVVASLGTVEDAKLRQAGDVYLYTRGKLEQVARLDAAVLAGKLEYTQTYTFLRAVEKRRDKQRKKALLFLATKGKSGSIKANALRTLAKIGLAESAVKQARKYVNDKDSYLKREARKLMVQYGETSIDDLKKQLETGPMLDRVDAAEMLLQLDDYSGEQVLIAALSGKDVKSRRKAAEVARQLLSRALLLPLVKALDDSDQTVRLQAHSSFKRLVAAMLPYRNLDWNKLAYKYNGSEASRKAAVKKLSSWLAQVVRKDPEKK